MSFCEIYFLFKLAHDVYVCFIYHPCQGGCNNILAKSVHSTAMDTLLNSWGSVRPLASFSTTFL